MPFTLFSYCLMPCFSRYVKWMMYWIVLAFFNSIEPFADIFIGFWFPFYYWLKIGVLLWLLAPASNGKNLLSFFLITCLVPYIYMIFFLFYSYSKSYICLRMFITLIQIITKETIKKSGKQSFTFYLPKFNS